MKKQELIVKSILISARLKQLFKSKKELPNHIYQELTEKLISLFSLKDTPDRSTLQPPLPQEALNFDSYSILSSSEWEEIGISFGLESFENSLGIGLTHKDQLTIYSFETHFPFRLNKEPTSHLSTVLLPKRNFAVSDTFKLIEQVRSLSLPKSDSQLITKLLKDYEAGQMFSILKGTDLSPNTLSLVVALGIAICSCEDLKEPKTHIDDPRNQKNISENVWLHKGPQLLTQLYSHFAFFLQRLN